MKMLPILPEREALVLSEERFVPEDERAFVDSCYALYEAFREGDREYRDRIRWARDVRALKYGALDPEEPKTGVPTPRLNTLNSTIDNMIADYLDNTPEAIMEPETPEQGDTADDMTDVVRWMLHHGGFQAAWRQVIEDTAVTGTGVIQVFWDEDLDCGGDRGGVRIEAWDGEEWLPDPLYDDFQLGRAIFKTCAHPMSWFMQHYPEHAAYIQADADSMLDAEDINETGRARYDDPLVALLEVWYRVYDAKTRRYAIHKAELAGGVLLYDSRKEYPNGVYKHGKYPFVTLRWREQKGTAYGTGAVHEFEDMQKLINRFCRYVDENVRASAKVKLLVKSGMVDPVQAADFDQTVVECANIDDTAIRWFQPAPLNQMAFTMMQFLQDNEKQDSGQNQFSRGEGGLGVTAASAIQMLQSAGGKITRMHTKTLWEGFRALVEQVMHLAGEFMDKPRVLMITGRDEGDARRPVELTPEMLRGGGLFDRPAYSVRVEVQVDNPDRITVSNQLLLQMDENSATKNMPIPPSVIAKGLRGIPGKDALVKLLEESDTQRQLMEQLQQAVEQLQAENQQLNEALAQAGQEMEAQKALLGEAAQQIQGQTPTPAGPAPGSPAPAIPGGTAGQAIPIERA